MSQTPLLSIAEQSAGTAHLQWSYRWFFPVAAIYGAVLVPLSLQGMLTDSPWIPALATPAAHARELLYGFALAVICGYLLGRMMLFRLLSILTLWLAARVSWFVAPGELIAGLFQTLFSGAMALHIAPKFMGFGRKWRNLSVAPLIILLALSAPLYDYVSSAAAISPSTISFGTVIVLAWLMAFMGGRLLAPAIAGQLGRQGTGLGTRVQPGIESGLILILALTAFFILFPATQILAAGLAIVGGILTAVRLLRWRFWQCRRRLDLWCLCAGYAWLAIGLMLFGLALLSGQKPYAVLHTITVGALGTLTINVMLRIHLQRRQDKPERDPLLIICTVLITAAAFIRISAATPIALTLAAAAWSAAYLLLALRLLQ